MRALLYRGPGDLRVENVPEPIASEGEVVVRVAVSGVCGTDAAEYTTGPHLYWIGALPHRSSGHSGPLIPGHELVGYVESIGAGVDGLDVGDLVASGAGVSCGSCRACRGDRTNTCERYWTVGLQRNGGLAEFVAVPAFTCVRVGPYGLTADAAGLAQPMAIAAHAVDRGAPTANDDVLVIGTGGIGTFVAYAASRSGARVVATDRDPARREVAARLGVDTTVPPGPGEQPLAPADVIFEVSGSRSGLRAALGAVRPGGRVVVVGMQEPPSELDLRSLALREVSLIGTVAHRCRTDLPAALRLLAEREGGWADIAPSAIPLEAVVEDALLPLAAGNPSRVKTLVDPRILSIRPTVMTHPPGPASRQD